MAQIKIISSPKKPQVPKSPDLNKVVPRFRPPGGKPPHKPTDSYKP